MSLLFSTCLMKWRLCIAIAEPQQSYPAANQKQTQMRRSVRVGPRWPIRDPSWFGAAFVGMVVTRARGEYLFFLGALASRSMLYSSARVAYWSIAVFTILVLRDVRHRQAALELVQGREGGGHAHTSCFGKFRFVERHRAGDIDGWRPLSVRDRLGVCERCIRNCCIRVDSLHVLEHAGQAVVGHGRREPSFRVPLLHARDAGCLDVQPLVLEAIPLDAEPLDGAPVDDLGFDLAFPA